MKKILFIAIVAIAFVSCKEKYNVEVNGKIVGSSGSVVYLVESTITGDLIIDSLKVNDSEKFSFQTNITEQTFYKVRNGLEAITLIVKPDDRISLNANTAGLIESAVIEGSNESSKYLELVKDFVRTEQKFTELRNKLSSLRVTDGYSEESKYEIDKEYLTEKIRHRNKCAMYIQENPTSLSSLLVVYHKFSDGKYILSKGVDLPFIKIACDSLVKYFPNSKRVELLIKDFDLMKNEANSQVLNDIVQSAQTSLPELLLPNYKGDSISLSSLKGKVVILNFWSYTDKGSVSNNQFLKSLYNEYKSKGLVIYSVSLDNNIEEWNKAVNFDQLPWINVIDTNYPNTIQTRIYNITSIPSYFIIDKDGEIVGRDLPLKRLKIRIENKL